MKIILVSHGSFAKGLLESVQMIAGLQDNIVAYGLYPENTVDSLKIKLQNEIESTPSTEEILCLTDLFFGSPFNAVVQLMEHFNLYHITGINMPLLLEALEGRSTGKSGKEICNNLMAISKDTIKDARIILETEHKQI